jgi:membrane-bound ClpP family serine protease
VTQPEERINPIPANARRDSGIFLALLGVTLLLYLLSVPWAFGMIVTGPAAAVFAALALYRSRSVRGITAFRVWLSLGLAFSLFSVIMSVTFMVFAGVLADLRSCTERAVTQQAKTECELEYEEGVTDVVDGWFEPFGVSVRQ